MKKIYPFTVENILKKDKTRKDDNAQEYLWYFPQPSNSISVKGGNPGQSQPEVEKRTRMTFSGKQLKVLEETFDKKKYITRREWEKLASELEISTRQVKIWFQNRRTKWKKQENIPTEHSKELLRNKRTERAVKPRKPVELACKKIVTINGLIFEEVEEGQGTSTYVLRD